MKTTRNTVLITGGSAGIGLEIARALDAAGNHVIITGRSEERLHKAAASLKQVTPIVSDVTDEQSVGRLAERMEQEFPKLNMLINNAGQAYAYELRTATGIAARARQEMETNFHAILHLNESLLPLLSRQEEAAIVNVSSIVAFVPAHNIPTYAASKAALHAYTQSLRHSLAPTAVKVFELMPPLVNTELSKDIGGAQGIPPQQVAAALLSAMEKEEYEIQVGATADLFQLFRNDPGAAFLAMNGQASLA